MKNQSTVRRLREALGLTQQELAQEMDWAISTVVRYERSRAAGGKALLELEAFAERHGLDELATEFASAFDDEFGLRSHVSR